MLWLRSPGINIPQDWPSPGQYIDVQNENRSFERDVDLAGPRRHAVRARREDAQRVEGLLTSSSLFQLLGAKPLYGRLLRPDEDAPGKPPVVILSHGFWKRAFSADPSMCRQSITLNGFGPGGGDAKNQFEVVGVLRPDFLLNDEIMPTVASIRQMDVFLPLPFGADAVTQRGDENYNLMARLKPGVTMAQATRRRGGDRGADSRQGQARPHVHDRRRAARRVRRRQRPAGGARRAGLRDARAADRVRQRRQPAAHARDRPAEGNRGADGARRELAATRPPAADRERAARSARAAPLDWRSPQAALQVVRAINPGNIPRLDAIGLDGTRARLHVRRVDCAPASSSAWRRRCARRASISTRRSRPAAGTRRATAASATSRRRLRSLLVVAEVAISLMLLIGAGLLVRSFVRLQQRVARLRRRGRRVDAARPERAPVRESRRRARVLSRRSARRWPRAGRHRARRGVVAAVHVVGRVGHPSTSKAGRRSRDRNCRSISAARRPTTSRR